MNHVTLFGNLGADPEVRYTPKGDACCEFNLAVTERWKDDQGQPQESTYWGRCQVWGASGETFAQFFRKGSKVLIEGCGLITLRVCVFRPSRIARTIGPLKSIGRSFTCSPPSTL